MFDLEKSIAGWRRYLLAVGIKTPGLLEELESHLREDVENQIRSGLSTRQAFEIATQRIGGAGALKSEFEKVETNERKFMKRILIISAGILGVLVGMAWVTPAVAQHYHEGAMSRESVWLFLLGSVVAITGLGAVICGLKLRRA